MITEQLAELVRSALTTLVAAGSIPAPAPEPAFERPKRAEHGDWATNVALAAASGGNPRAIAQQIVDALPGSPLVERIEIAGPGFINFHLADEWLHDVIRRAADPRSGFGRSDVGARRKVNVEYVSANPTGPINIVSGRHAATGDAIASLLEATGHEVVREYYINDAGRQIDLFGASIGARYLERLGRPAEVPEDGYQGAYVADLAEQIHTEVGDRYLDSPEDERTQAMAGMGLERMRSAIRDSLERFGSTFEVWFSESSLHDSGAVEKGIDALRTGGWVYEKEGALWFRSSDLGDDKDRVLIRAGGEPTYLAGDVAYLRDKIGRGFDHLIYQWGADHHGTVARLKAAATALGIDPDRIEIRLVQVVALTMGGETLKGSKRAGRIVELDELIAEVGVDAARYTFLTRSADAPLEFDIELAKEQAPENPVYYVQYAHARICSILRKAEGYDPGTAPQARLGRLGHDSEMKLARKLAAYEETIVDAAQLRAPQRVTRYVEELASSFSAFYRDCKVMTDDEDLTGARLALCVATRAVIADALGLLGVGAPERM